MIVLYDKSNPFSSYHELNAAEEDVAPKSGSIIWL